MVVLGVDGQEFPKCLMCICFILSAVAAHAIGFNIGFHPWPVVFALYEVKCPFLAHMTCKSFDNPDVLGT
jgi:hypothetical protein